MDEVKRWVNLSFVFLAILLSWFSVHFVKTVFGSITSGFDLHVPKDHALYTTVGGIALAIIGTIALFRNKKIYDGAIHVAREMRKVTWPSMDETKHAMKVVIVTVVIVATILFCFDIVAKELTGLILGIG